MAEEGADLDRGEPATPFKLDEAQKKGLAAKSTELVSTVSLLSGCIAVAASGAWGARHLLRDCSALILSAGQLSLDSSHVVSLLSRLAMDVAFVVSPLLALVVIGSILGNFLQTGLIFSTTPLKPDFQRLNPAAGLKRLFSMRTGFALVKTCVKLVLLSTLTYFLLRGLLPGLPGLYFRGPIDQVAVINHQIVRTVTVLGAGALLIALVDLVYSRWDFSRSMRMSRKELRDEIKRREGDPRIKDRRRALLREMRRRSQAAGNVKGADVLITNPTHYAVALKYRRGKAVAPEIVAKGAGHVAQQLREAAFRYRVPIVPNPRLAQALYREVRIGQPVPEEYYGTVADILRWVYQIRQKRSVDKN